MQVNNPTAGDIARWYSGDFGGMSGSQLASQMFNPAIAIAAGTDLLGHKISGAGGNVSAGLGNYYGSNNPAANASYANSILSCAK